MNTLSISGKNWILKKYNQEEISFLKDNFFLDEITSKLLSIRKIKKEDIKSFLKSFYQKFFTKSQYFNGYGKSYPKNK